MDVANESLFLAIIMIGTEMFTKSFRNFLMKNVTKSSNTFDSVSILICFTFHLVYSLINVKK